MTIIKFVETIPDGVLVFFKSYASMQKCEDCWKEQGIWSALENLKRIFREPRTKLEFEATMKGYYGAINDLNSGGAIFMAVMRGKVSEGLDFADMYGRAVIITGLPLAPWSDPKIRLKRSYMDENRTLANEMLTGQQWYHLDGVRAVNQAIGRVIRHKNDYGAILLCDDRFSDRDYSRYISDWIAGNMKKQHYWEPFDLMIKNLENFYKNAERTVNNSDH